MERAKIIYGPTASGKSAYAVALAKELGGEIINCDARQVYKGMAVGTGAVTEEEMQGVPHHLLLFRDPLDPYDVGEFLRDAQKVEQEIRARGHVPIYVGGTGLYVQALVEGLSEGIKVDPALRAALEARSLHDLVEELQRVDPASTVDVQNKRYVVRALEIFHTTGAPKSQLQLPQASDEYEILALVRSKEALNARIDARHAEMFTSGALQAEVKALEGKAHPEVWKTIGYPQAAALLHGEITLESAITQTQAAARQYAKRQRTWLRRMEQRLPIKKIGIHE